MNRMRTTATCLLAVMLVLLLACAACQAAYPWLHWVRAFAEAGTVGAIADWYAVVVLFRHPLGLRIPHTAIIPRSHERIGEGLGNFVQEHFLTPEVVIGKLRACNTAKAIAAWLANSDNSQSIAESVSDTLPGLLKELDDRKVARFLERVLVPQLRTLDASSLAGNVLKIVTENNRHQPLLDRALRALKQWLLVNEGVLKARFSAASRYTPARLDSYIVDKFVEGIVALLHEVVANPQHELRRQFDGAIRDLAVKLETSGRYQRVGRTLMRDCVRHLKNEGCYRVLWNQLRTRVTADVDRERSFVRRAIAGALISLAEALKDDATVQLKLNAWLLNLAQTLVPRAQHQVAALITEVVKSWGAGEVSRKIEAEIGRDLQYIRINGTFVGGTVGVLLHAAVLLVAR
ncbi:uncharacterized membrane-anchored protein YjiN (DUF445 family) [Paraburkholderia sp. MM5477-R1]